MSALMPFREPWFRPTEDQAHSLEAEARREIAHGHELHGLAFRAVAQCGGCDRVVFALPDGTWAILHLTWTPSGPDIPPWPKFDRYGGFIAIETGMDEHVH